MVTTNIKKERNKKGLTQSQLAEKIGVSKQTICDWEKGRSIPSYMKLKLLSKILEKPIDYLLEQEIDSSNSKKWFNIILQQKSKMSNLCPNGATKNNNLVSKFE